MTEIKTSNEVGQPTTTATRRGLDDHGTPSRALKAAKLLLAEKDRQPRAVGWRDKTVNDLGKSFEVSSKSIRRALRLLRHGDQDILEAIANGKMSLGKGLKSAGMECNPDTPKGLRVEIGGSKNYVEFYQRTKTMPGTNLEKARALKITEQSFRYIEIIVLLSEQNDLSVEDTNKCRAALAHLEQNGQPSAAYKKIKSIAERVWHGRQRRHKPNPNNEKFGQSLAVIEQMAHSAKGMAIPYLGPEAMKSALQIVQNAILALKRLRGRIREN